ncbi:hypothetical protein DFH06DRAFT_1144783 [Mycena polygramma]|nr:hypothetical protein DFH06DRAFT_1144783 [Mycena polygramma]
MDRIATDSMYSSNTSLLRHRQQKSSFWREEMDKNTELKIKNFKLGISEHYPDDGGSTVAKPSFVRLPSASGGMEDIRRLMPVWTSRLSTPCRNPNAKAELGSLRSRTCTLLGPAVDPKTSNEDIPGKYNEEHMAWVAQIPGWKRGRRYKLVQCQQIRGEVMADEPCQDISPSTSWTTEILTAVRQSRMRGAPSGRSGCSRVRFTGRSGLWSCTKSWGDWKSIALVKSSKDINGAKDRATLQDVNHKTSPSSRGATDSARTQWGFIRAVTTQTLAPVGRSALSQRAGVMEQPGEAEATRCWVGLGAEDDEAVRVRGCSGNAGGEKLPPSAQRKDVDREACHPSPPKFTG